MTSFQDNPDFNPTRFEKSLGVLTIKFVSLLKESEGGILDLKVAADALNVRQKRRIYDITNVLEGIGLIEKRNKNCIVWKGAIEGEDTKESADKLKVLEYEVDLLEKHELMLDQQKLWAQQSIKNILDDTSNYHLSYVTNQDICKCFDGQTLLAIQAPNGTQLEVPLPEAQMNGSTKYQIHLKSEDGQIYVLLVNKEADSDPVVVQVPPPAEVAEALHQQQDIIPLPPEVIPTNQPSRLNTTNTTITNLIQRSINPGLGSLNEGIPRELKLDNSTCEPELPIIHQSYSTVKKEFKEILPAVNQRIVLNQVPSQILQPNQGLSAGGQILGSVQLSGGFHLTGSGEQMTVVDRLTGSGEHMSLVDRQQDLNNATSQQQVVLGKRSLSPGYQDTGRADLKKRVQDITMPHLGMEVPGLDDLITSEMWGPLLRLSPPPSDKDYCFNLDNSEGVCDLFDVL